MASLILKMSVSLDGYVASADGTSDWIAAGRSPDSGKWVLDIISNAGVHLMGSTTYAGMSAYWPTDTSPFAAPMNEIPKVVFSDSLTTAEWGETTIVPGYLAEAVARLKQEHSDKYLLALGGAAFSQSLVATGLIDEFHLAVHPVVLGTGIPLFTGPLTLEPISTTAFSGGAVGHVFAAHT